MIVEVLEQKYKCGCNRGMNDFTQPGLLKKINRIIDWEHSYFPKNIIHKETIKFPKYDSSGNAMIKGFKEEEVLLYEENRNFLGDTKELRPGNCILLNGSVIAIDSEDRIVLVLSETGRMSLNRIYVDIIEPEYSYIDVTVPDDFKVQINNSYVESDFDQEIAVPYVDFKLWKDRLACSKYRDEKNIRFTIQSPLLLYPIDLLFSDWVVKYKSEDFEPEEDNDLLSDYIKLIISWFLKNVKGIDNGANRKKDDIGTLDQQRERYLEEDKKRQLEEYNKKEKVD